MQLVAGRVRILNPTKDDLLSTQKSRRNHGCASEKGCGRDGSHGRHDRQHSRRRDPNEKPAPGERRKAGIGEVGARQLIQQFGSAEETLEHAAEVKRANYREALEKYGEFVRLSKQLATIPTDAPVPLSLRR